MTKNRNFFKNAFICLTLSLALNQTNHASQADTNKPLLVIGASYSDGSTPFNDALVAPLGGVSVGLGTYLSLGNALVKNPRLAGYVVNEAQAGATTFDRLACNPNPSCTSGTWQGYDKQLTKALARVTIPGTTTTTAKFVVITIGNDCLHSDAFGVPQNQSQPCSITEMNNYIDRLIAVGQRILNLGLTPIFDIYPDYHALNLPFAAQAFGLNWIIDQHSYNTLRQLHRSRIKAALAQAVVLDMWAGFEHVGDGLHPNDKTSRKAAEKIAKYIQQAH
ncbi:SGNH/GDSL hydrolase family protein [Agitococcus lubricus]|uniref:Lysophospholipase L1-like esterase n=1 Tax=Agitococcus lubricus TaxID=1077255 RepID=A0A2T5ISH1_9GAMM|nr:SGNH/GDSL hydrolase family protein [Agitococcus lubricus]PTQ86783.1 hypothetical protein C8N29_1282 [Agitococcus lubricus]